jgi:hypothetical protein
LARQGALISSKQGQEDDMGIWRGTAPLSTQGDWTHGPLLQLKFNQHGSTKEISDTDTKSIGKAYTLASTIIDFVLGKLRDHAVEEKYSGDVMPKYFGDWGVAYFSDGFDTAPG